jgi:hypothetical protein
MLRFAASMRRSMKGEAALRSRRLSRIVAVAAAAGRSQIGLLARESRRPSAAATDAINSPTPGRSSPAPRTTFLNSDVLVRC